MILAVYLPLALGIVGVALSVAAYLRTRSAGFVPAALAFCIPTAIALRQWAHVHQFTQVEIEPGVWSSPVLRASVPDLVIYTLVLVSVVLLSRKNPKDSEQQNARD